MFHYYTEDGSVFSSKVEAMEYSHKSNTPLHFYYYDEEYSRVPWTLEPPQSLDYYYLEQAKRIRDQYDYVILCYSGGYDSTNILETFHYNGLKLDKIVAVGAFDQDNYTVSDENHNGELYLNVFPYIKELGLEGILQVVDYSKLFSDLSNFSILNQKDSWVDLCGGWFSPHHWFWHDAEKYIVPEEFKTKKVAILFGKDKPALFSTDTSLVSGFRFRDTPINSYGSTSLNRQNLDNIKRIDFYWDPEYPEILVKQLHILRRHFLLTQKLGYDDLEAVGTIGESSINSLVYNLRKPILFKSPKSKTYYLSLRDQFLKSKMNSLVAETHNRGIAELTARIGDKSPQPIFSKFYSII